MKKGLSYIDWSISAGIFIIYIIVLFILLGPAFKQDYSPDYLGSLVREGIKENVSLEIKRIPLFIELNTSNHLPCQNVSYNCKFKLTGNLPAEVVTLNPNEKQFSFFNQDLSIEFMDKSNEISGNNRLKFVTKADNMGISSFNPPRSEIVKIWMFLSEEEIFEDRNISSHDWIPEAFTFGVAETLEGIYEPYFINFTNNDYETAKDIINFPKEREFAIDIYNHTDFTSPILNYTKTQPGEKDIVNTLLWADYLIHNNTQRTPITILIKTW